MQLADLVKLLTLPTIATTQLLTSSEKCVWDGEILLLFGIKSLDQWNCFCILILRTDVFKRIELSNSVPATQLTDLNNRLPEMLSGWNSIDNTLSKWRYKIDEIEN